MFLTLTKHLWSEPLNFIFKIFTKFKNRRTQLKFCCAKFPALFLLRVNWSHVLTAIVGMGIQGGGEFTSNLVKNRCNISIVYSICLLYIYIYIVRYCTYIYIYTFYNILYYYYIYINIYIQYVLGRQVTRSQILCTVTFPVWACCYCTTTLEVSGNLQCCWL